MTRIILNAQAVRALLEQDPEFFGELAKTAAAQVAQEFLTRSLKVDIKARLNHEFNAAFGHEWQGWKLSTAIKTAIASAVSSAVDTRIKELSENLVRNELHKQLDAAQLGEKLDARLEAAVKRVLARGIR